MKKFITDNKLVSVMLAFLFTSIVTYSVLFNTWVTNQLFSHKEAIAVRVAEEKATSKQMKEMKEELSSLKKEVKEELKEVGSKIDENYKDMMNIPMRTEKRGKRMEEIYEKGSKLPSYPSN